LSAILFSIPICPIWNVDLFFIATFSLCNFALGNFHS
jgi:hypothetical protein